MDPEVAKQCSGQLCVLSQQGIANNQTLAYYIQNSFIKDQLQGGQGEIGQLVAALNAASAAPVPRPGVEALTLDHKVRK